MLARRSRQVRRAVAKPSPSGIAEVFSAANPSVEVFPVPDHSSAQHEALIRRYLEVVFNGHHLDGLETFLATNLVSHWLGMEALHGIPAWKAAMGDFFAAFPDLTYRLDDCFFVADKGVWRGTWHGTQRGDWAGIAATGREATWTAVIMGRFADGKLAEDWVEFDRLGLFQQLGAIPIPR
jgi:predicted ester cyclase